MNFIKNERVIGLDVIRAISIVAVVFGHSFSFFLRADDVPYIGRISPAFAEDILTFGVLGVELFFVLSGFLIGGILIRSFLDADDFKLSDVGQFWIRRWFRTLPNYWLILCITLLLYRQMEYIQFHAYYLKGFLFLQNLRYPNTLEIFPEAWSLSVEEWFYLTLPIVMYLCSLIARPHDKGKFLLRVFIGYLMVFLFIRFFNAFDPLNGRDPDEGIRKVVVFRLDAVMYGVLFAYFTYYRNQLLLRIKKQLLAIGVIGFIVLFYFIIKYDLVFQPQANLALRFTRNAFLYVAIPLLFSLCLPYANSIKTIKNETMARFIVHISKVSYSVYLVHYSLVYRAFFEPPGATTFKDTSLLYILYWIIVFGLASFIYKYYEYPVMKLRDRFAVKRPKNLAKTGM